MEHPNLNLTDFIGIRQFISNVFSYPAASLTWFLNAEKARESMVTSYMAKVGSTPPPPKKKHKNSPVDSVLEEHTFSKLGFLYTYIINLAGKQFS
jgi:hypothetical protein